MPEPTSDSPPQLRLLGAAHWRSGLDRRDLPDNLPGYLTAYLAYRADWVSREALAGLFWPERAEDEAQHNLRANLHRVRSLLTSWGMGDSLQADRRRVRIDLPTDVSSYRAALGRAHWPAAVALHGEPLLSAMSFRGFALLEEWARGERQALTDAWRDAVLKAALAHEQGGEGQPAAALLLRLLQADAGTEDAMQALLRVASAGGRRDEALAAFERFRRWLEAELGLQPMPATVALADALRTGAQAPVRTAVAPAVAGVPRAVIQPPRVVGRDPEVAQLADTAQRLIAVGGEPGVGKTRLLEEALPGARWIACREGLAQVPFAPLIEYLHDFRDSLPELGEFRLDLARLLPELADGELLPPADPALGKARLLDALAHVLEDGERPLVFDDVQWSDAATAELIVSLARRARVPLRLAHRMTEPVPALDELLDALEAAGLLRMVLEPLSAEALRELLAELSHSAAGPPKFSAWLHARTGGNPFFALQTLRALFESRRLAATEVGWSSDLDAVTIDYSELEVPARVADLVRRRLRGLSDTARRVLGVVAVCGSARDVERIAATVGLSAWATAEALAEAERAGLLRDGRFVHDVIRESHLGSLAEPLRVVLHSAVARHFDGVLPPAQIAEHWWAASNAAAAVEATVLAARTYSGEGLFDEAVRLLNAAQVRVGDSSLKARVLANLGQVSFDCERLDEAEAQAVAALAEVIQPADRALAWKVRAGVALRRGSTRLIAEALAEARSSQASPMDLVELTAGLAALKGEPAAAIGELTELLDRLRAERPSLDMLVVLKHLAMMRSMAGESDKALPHYEEAQNLARRMGARYLESEIAGNRVAALIRLGRLEAAATVGEAALEIGKYESSDLIAINLAYCYLRLGRLERGIALFERVRTTASSLYAAHASGQLIEAYSRAAQLRAAEAACADAIERLRVVDVAGIRAGVCIAILQFGSDEWVERARPFFPVQGLTASMRVAFKQALIARGIDSSRYVQEKSAGASNADF
jgi:DNA-binding SARP family transcriptional activator